MRATSIFSAASVLMFVLLVGAPLAQAEINVDFECTIPTSPKFDCNMLKRRVLQEKPLPFVKEGVRTGRTVYSLKILVSRREVLNGDDYEISIGEKGKSAAQLPPVFISDGTDPTAALIQINKKIQAGIGPWSDVKDEAEVSEGTATLEYSDPYSVPTSKKSEGKWVLVPTASGNLEKYSGTPSTYNGSGGINFNYSGDRVRVVTGANGRLNRQGQTVPSEVDQKPKFFGVNTHEAAGYGAVVVGLDRGNHLNLALSLDAATAPSSNLDSTVSAEIGFEYNLRPFRKQDSLAFAAGCTAGPSYDSYGLPNYLEKTQFLALTQTCNIAGQILLDKKRGSSLSGQVGETWVLNQRDVASVNGSISLDLKVTDRWKISPSVNVSRQTKSLVAVSPAHEPNFEGLVGQERANAQVDAANRATASSAASVSGNLSLSYTFGEGVNRSAQDQRGMALKDR